MRVTDPVSLFATAVWLASACPALGETSRLSRIEGRSADGRRKAAVVEVADAEGTSSLVLQADAAAANYDPGEMLAAFDRRVERMEWSGEDLLLGFDAARDVRAFSIFPGIRILPAMPPANADANAPLAGAAAKRRGSRSRPGVVLQIRKALPQRTYSK